MLLEQFQRLYAYNDWAWQCVFTSVRALGQGRYHEEQPLFARPMSIHERLVHCLSAETLWLARVQGNSPSSMLDPGDYTEFTAVETDWAAVSAGWHSYLDGLSEEALSQEIDYRNTRGNGFTLPLYDILQHVVNHATEHRSQITPLLFRAGARTEPLDYMRMRLRAAAKERDEG